VRSKETRVVARCGSAAPLRDRLGRILQASGETKPPAEGRVRRWLVVGIVLSGLTGLGVYRYVTRPRFEATVTPVYPLGYHLVIRNVGHRGAYATCRATAFDEAGRKIFTHVIPTGPAGPYLDPGTSVEIDEQLPNEWVTGSIARLHAICSPIGYPHGPPV
jgi:hypothetical protein